MNKKTRKEIDNNYRKYFMEFIGTFMYTYVSCWAIL